MKNIKFYYCSNCGNIITTDKAGEISCCGNVLEALIPEKCEDSKKLEIDSIDHEYFIHSDHEMTKENYISFLAFVNGDTLILKKLYPEWNLETRIPKLSRGKLYWFSVKEGFFYQLLK